MKYLLIILLLVSCEKKLDNSFKLPPSIYGENIQVIILSPEEAKKIDSTLDFFTLEALTISDGGDIIIWFPDYNRGKNTVDHELFHATYAVMDWVGIPLTDDTEEAYAYLLDYLSKEFYERYR